MVQASECLYPQLRLRSSKNSDSKVQSHSSTHLFHTVHLSPNGNIYACVFPINPCRPIEISFLLRD